MKKIILLVIALWCSGVVWGQDIYQFKTNTVLKTSENLEVFTTNNSKLINFTNSAVKTEAFYKKIGEFGEFVMLQNTQDETDRFTTSKSEVNSTSEKVGTRWNFGIVTLPMKIRFGGGSEEKNNRRYFDLSADFNLGLALSCKLNKSNFTSEVQSYWLLSVGTSQVKLTPESTSNFIANDETTTAFSPSTGLVFKFLNDIQFITLVGWDFIPGKVGREWLYRDKPFFGIGIGFKAFEIGKKIENPK